MDTWELGEIAMHRKALVTGITGQDGSYLAEFLLSKGYEVHGIIRRTSGVNQSRINHLCNDEEIMDKRFFPHFGDLDNSSGIFDIIQSVQPDELYNLGGQSHVGMSFETPEYTGDVSGLAVTRLLEAIRKSNKSCRFYQASSSELFGSTPPPQSEDSPFHPRSPYAVSKIYGYWAAVNYREAYGLHANNGILFNHESPRRGEDFVTRKITRSVSRIVAGNQKKLLMGNIDNRKDWGFAPDYVECMWRILQQDEPDDFVIGTGENHSVKDFLELAFGYVGLDWKKFVEIDPKFFRPADVNYTQADASKAKRLLNWSPRVNFEEMVSIMMDYDLRIEGCALPGKGFSALKEKDFTWLRNTTG
jgi:GDPmannose 4,6-dehydratase